MLIAVVQSSILPSSRFPFVQSGGKWHRICDQNNGSHQILAILNYLTSPNKFKCLPVEVSTKFLSSSRLWSLSFSTPRGTLPRPQYVAGSPKLHWTRWTRTTVSRNQSSSFVDEYAWTASCARDHRKHTERILPGRPQMDLLPPKLFFGSVFLHSRKHPGGNSVAPQQEWV